MRRLEVWTFALAVAPILLPAEPVKPGLWKEFAYDRPSKDPVVFSGWCRAQNAEAGDCCLWLDIRYDNGEAVWGRKAVFRQGSHDWEESCGVFVPTRPVAKIEVFALFRSPKGAKTKGTVEFRDFRLERREGRGERLPLSTFNDRPFSNADVIEEQVFKGRETHRTKHVVPRSDPPASPVPSGKFVVWTEDSMTRVTPLTFPPTEPCRRIVVAMAKRERESAQVLISSAADAEWKSVTLEMPLLRRSDGKPLAGSVTWQRQGYLARESGASPHPFAFPSGERWFPDPLLQPAPMRVRAASTQGAWITVHAQAEAEAGIYTGEIAVREAGVEMARVPVEVTVHDFALPSTFGLKTAFSLMDGFTRALYPDDFRAKNRACWDILLDHRLNPDDISRTTPPDIDDLVYARSRGMNSFNILNIVPPPKDPKTRWTLVAKPEEIFNDAFYAYYVGVVKPYVEKLRPLGLDKLAYVYGFDERTKEYYAGIESFWQRFRKDVPGIPLMATAKNYRDFAAGKTDIPHLLSGDWYCPTTQDYRLDVSDRLRAQGKQVWWYTCCAPYFPYANFASWEYPLIEGRLLGWMTHRWRADGFLFWIVNKWHGTYRFREDDTYFPDYPTFNGNGVPGDGILLYPGESHVLPSIRLAQWRDAVEDYEYLQLAERAGDRKRADAVTDSIIRSLTDFTRSPSDLRRARKQIAELVCKGGAMARHDRLSPGNWQPSVRSELEELICRNAGDPTAYAVFDFDNTTAIGDISNTCQWRMLETLAFKHDFAAALKSGIPALYHARVDAMASRIPALQAMDEKSRVAAPSWHTLAKEYWLLYDDLLKECGTETAYPWIGHLFAGYTSDEYRAFAQAAAKRALMAGGGLSTDPDAPCRFPRGLSLTPEVRDLYRALQEAGIAVYVVSASNRELVLAMTDGTFGLNLAPDCVFGYRLQKDASGRYLPRLDAAQPGPNAKGKVEIIRAFIAPRHRGADPILTAGDSMGDYAMMTSFPKLQAALIFNRSPKSGPLAELISRASDCVSPKVLVQGRSEGEGRLVPSHESK